MFRFQRQAKPACAPHLPDGPELLTRQPMVDRPLWSDLLDLAAAASLMVIASNAGWFEPYPNPNAADTAQNVAAYRFALGETELGQAPATTMNLSVPKTAQVDMPSVTDNEPASDPLGWVIRRTGQQRGN